MNESTPKRIPPELEEIFSLATFQLYRTYGLGTFNCLLTNEKKEVKWDEVVASLKHPTVLNYALDQVSRYKRQLAELEELIEVSRAQVKQEETLSQAQGSGWCLLEKHEKVEEGDEAFFTDIDRWEPSVNYFESVGGKQDSNLTYRRRTDVEKGHEQ